MLGRMSDKKDKPTLRNSIEENLRKVYQEMLEEEVPDRFKQLLAQLKAAQSKEAQSKVGPAETAGNAAADIDDGEGVK